MATKKLGKGLSALFSIYDDEPEETLAQQDKRDAVENAKAEEITQKDIKTTQEIQENAEKPQDLGENYIESVEKRDSVHETEQKPLDSSRNFYEEEAPRRPRNFAEADEMLRQRIPAGFMPRGEKSHTTESAQPAFGETEQTEYHENENLVCELPISAVVVNPNQPRKNFEEGAMAELTESVKQHGIIQPIIVNAIGEGQFMIIAGERRYRAAKMAGLTTIPCIIRNYTERQIKEVALIENLQREDLNPIEAARAIKQLMEEYNFTQEIVADRIGKSRPSVTNMLRLLNLTPEVILLVEKNLLSPGHARTIVVITDKNMQIKIAKTIIDKKLSVREVEKLVREIMRPKRPKAEKVIPVRLPEIIEFEENLQKLFATKVQVIGSEAKGRIVIDYFSKDDLDRIYEMMELIRSKKLTLEDLQNYNKHK